MPHLAVVLHPTPSRAGRIDFSDKTLSGLAAIHGRWPGRLTVVAPAVDQDLAGNLGVRSHAISGLPYVVVVNEASEALRALAPDVVQLNLDVREKALVTGPWASVIVAENSSHERYRLAMSHLPAAKAPRVAAGALRQWRTFRAMVSRATAVQCNGWGAWETFSPLARHHPVAPLRYFDTRLPASRVRAARESHRGRPASVAPRRLAFSGRLSAEKGPMSAVRASRVLDDHGFEHTLTIFGAGPQEAALRAHAGPSTRFAGSVDFDPTWMDTISASVDLMVLPHTQGDPSGTYLEAAGLGVPTVGFANVALRGHEREGGFAWTVPMRDDDALAEKILRLAEQPDAVRAAAARGIQFMEQHCAERQFDDRVAHLLEAARFGGARR